MTSIVVPSRAAPIAGAHGSPAAAIAARRERVFFSSLAVLLLVTVFGGFARTYYLNGFVSAPFALTPALHWHGAAFTAWMLLLVTQTSLIATGRAHLHRRLGVVGAVLAVAMIGLGGHVAISRTAGGTIADHGAPPLLFLAVPLVGMVVFAALVGSALYLRHHPAAHKRLMMLATLELVTAGVSRLPIVDSWGPVGFFAVTDLFLLAMIVYDWTALGRVHTATLLGGAFLIASQPLRLILGATGIWTAFATWLVA